MTERIPIGLQAAGIRILIDAHTKGLTISAQDVSHLKPHWEAAYATLKWFMENEAKIKAALARERVKC
jgi:hypothetical protein